MSDEPPTGSPDDTRPPEHAAEADTTVTAGEALSGEGAGVAPAGQVGRPGGPDATQPRAPRQDADDRPAGRTPVERGAGPSSDVDQDLDAETIAEGVRDFLEPPAGSPTADADAPPPG